MKRLLFVLCVFVILLSLVPSTFSQSKVKGGEEIRERESGAAGHLLWFMEGRTLPDGSPAAKYVSEAHKQKMALRQTNVARRNAARAAGVTQAAAANGGSSWTSIGPSPIADDGFYGPVGGRVDSVAVDPTDPTGNTVYIGGAFGGLWKSTNGAAPTPSAVIWTPLLDQQATLSVGAIAIQPGHSNVILVGTGENKNAGDSYYGVGVLRSTDGGSTWAQIASDSDPISHSFLGIGFSRITFSTANPNLVVAATGSAAKGRATGLFTSTSVSGLFYSTDAGATWRSASVTDSGTPVSAAANSVIYNAAVGKFFASIRFHGVYQSADGANWTRAAAQPDPTKVNLTSCPTTAIASCPFYRGELASRSDSNDMFVWYASTSIDSTAGNGGVWRSKDGGTSWTGLDMTGVNNCDAPGESQDACGVYQASFYNMYVGVAPNPSNVAATDVYIGAGNIFKCTLDAAHTTCANTLTNPNRWMNVTRVYGCANIPGTIASVHPDQQGIAFSSGSVAYFVNDGGIYRTRNTGGLIDDSCTATVPFENLNNYPLSLTQFVWGTPHPTDPEAFLGGAQDVGTSLRTSSSWGSTQKLWLPLPVGGDGGYNAFTPNGSLLQSWTDSDINICTVGLNCATDNGTNWHPLVRTTCPTSNPSCTYTLGGDTSAFYMPWILDPRDKTKILMGTCRVWRGPSQTTFVGTALSQKLSDVSGLPKCGDNGTASDRDITAIAAGGPAAPSGGSSVIYASLTNGTIWKTTSSDSLANWTNITPPTSLNPGPNWSPTTPFKISALWVEPSVGTGLTVYATVQGFSTPHVLKSIDGGLNWTNITSNLPDAPVNSITTDPDDATIVYVGTDNGVFTTTNNGASWIEVGSTEPGGLPTGFLPNVPVTRVTMFKSAANNFLYAVTYGRGVWRVGVAAVTSTPSSGTMTAGSPKTFAISTTANGWSGASITFSCTGLPSSTNCAFNPASVVPGGSTTLTISTTKIVVGANRVSHAPLFGLWLGLPGILLLPLAGANRRNPKMVSIALLFVLLFMVGAMASCGGGGSSSTPAANNATPAGTYTVQVVATSGGVSQSTPITLTVQ